MVSNIAGYRVSRSPSAALGERWRDSRAFATVAAIAYGFAGIVLPIVGWVVGAAMVWASPRWTARQKRASLIVPIVLAAVGVLVTAVATAATEWSQQHPMVAHVPSGYDAAWSAIVVVLIVTASMGLWLRQMVRD